MISENNRAMPDITYNVVQKVANREGVDSEELMTPLNEVVDADALEALVSSMDEGNEEDFVQFEYLGYVVRVFSDGEVGVEGDGGEVDLPEC